VSISQPQLRRSAHSFVYQQRQQTLLVSGEPEPIQSPLKSHRSHTHLVDSASDNVQRAGLDIGFLELSMETRLIQKQTF
jgi:hypothetical protein